MTNKDLYIAIGKVDDDILEQSEVTGKKNSRLKWGAAAACLCLCIIGAVSLFHPKGDQPSHEVQTIAALEFDGCYYEICDLDWVLENYGLPGKITPELAGEHLAYLKHSDSSSYEETAAQTDIELYQYAPSPCRGVYVVRDGENYLAALFCNFRLDNSNASVKLSELYRVYGINGAEDISKIVRTKSHGKTETIVGSAVTAPETIAEFYKITTSLESCGNDDFQDTVFNHISEENQPAAHTAFADDAITVRIESKTGLSFYLRVFPSYGWIYGPRALSYYRMNEAVYGWLETNWPEGQYN